MTTAAPARSKLIPGVKHVIAVASGKGGVGKSTVSANLALALAGTGARVGLLDADVYGPSIPTILGTSEKPQPSGEEKIAPISRYGIKVISTGFFLPANEAVIWRGPMLHKMVQDLLGIVDWGELDYLVIDLPPGTGDVQLSLCQSIPLTGAVIVSTPQDVAWNVAQKAILMFDKLNAPVLGVIENMSRYACSHCGHEEDIFGSGGAKRAAERLGIPYLGAIPLLTDIRKTSDAGDPVVHAQPASAGAKAFEAAAKRTAEEVKRRESEGDKRAMPVKSGPPGQPFFVVEWSDGTKTSFESRAVRLACPCAACVDEVSGRRMLNPDSVRADVAPLSFHPIGRYALMIVWSDGHNTGLYGYEYLKRLGREA